MNVDDRDWLEQRLAGGDYVPDDGFTARVVERLPVRRARSLTRRQSILAVAAILALVLVIVQIGSLVRGLRQVSAGYSISGLIGEIETYTHGSLFPIYAASAMTVLVLASLWLLRRWI